MTIVIDRIENTHFTYGQVVNLIHSAFEERLSQGLHFTCSSMSEDQFRAETKKGVVFVSFDADTETLLGTMTVHIRRDKKGVVYGYAEFLAISPEAKRLGIGTGLLQELVSFIISAGGQYVLSDTAVGANSSVQWHLKNGFKIIGLQSFPNTNYYSYIFRKQFSSSGLWNTDWYPALVYWVSYVKIKSIKKEDGSFTLLGSFFKRLMK